MCQGGAFGRVSLCVSVNQCGLHLVKTGCGFFLLDCVILSVCVCMCVCVSALLWDLEACLRVGV